MRFVLIHGGFHGAWCWTRTIAELETLGHEAIAIDLPGHGERRDEVVTLALRQRAIVDVLQAGDVLVGHSGGGFDISIAADAATELVAHLVYLAAGLPLEGRTLLDFTGGTTEPGESPRLMDEDIGVGRFSRMNAQGRVECVDEDAAIDHFYHDCDRSTAEWAYSHFTPAPIEFMAETVSIPRFWAADLPRSYILCRDDRALPAVMRDEVIRRLGVDPLAIDGSHSPFLSRPAELAKLLVRATQRQPSGPLAPR